MKVFDADYLMKWTMQIMNYLVDPDKVRID